MDAVEEWSVRDLGTTEQFERLLRHPEIASVEITKEAILITTKRIYLDRYEKFLIETNGDGAYANSHWTISIDLLGRYEMMASHGWLTPRINFQSSIPCSTFANFAGNVACFGNILSMVRALYKAKQYAALAIVCVEFIKQTADTGKNGGAGSPGRDGVPLNNDRYKP